MEHLLVGDALAKRMTDDLFKCYRGLLGDEQVFASVLRLAAKCKAAAKSQDAKRAVDEWAVRVEEAHLAQSEEASTVEKAAGKAKGRRRPLDALVLPELPAAVGFGVVAAGGKKPARKAGRNDEDQAKPKGRGAGRPQGAKKKKKAQEELDDDEQDAGGATSEGEEDGEENLKPRAKPEPPKAGARWGGRRAVPADD
jgi:hypothetical protein